MSPVLVLGAGALLALTQAAVALGQDAPAAGKELRFTAITAGGAHSCGLTADSAAYCWGRNEFGQLGDSSNTDHPTPVLVRGGIAFQQLTAGADHTCGVDSYGAAYCWGKNDYGQAGIGTRSTWNYPVRVMGGLRASVVSAGAQHTCARIIHWQRQDQVVCWGRNSHGQLGTRETSDALGPVSTFGGTRYTSVASGSQHTCAASTEGTVYCWGANARGQLGNASRTASPVRFPVRMRGRKTFSSVTVGATHSCALTSEGEAYCWGDNSAGQLGTGKGGYSMTPAPLGDSLRFTALSAGGDATCGVRRDGGVLCWGSNGAGQFGTAAPTGSRTPVPALPGLAPTVITLGRAHACGLQADGSAYCWGQLGNEVGASSAEPVRVPGPP